MDTPNTFLDELDKVLNDAFTDTMIGDLDFSIAQLETFEDQLDTMKTKKTVDASLVETPNTINVTVGSSSMKLPKKGKAGRPKKDISKENIKSRVAKYYSTTGKIPTTRTIKRDTGVTADIIKDRFGSYQNMLDELGFNKNIKIQTSKENIIHEMKKHYIQTGQVPELRQLSVSKHIILNRFGTYKEALKEAGMENLQREIEKEEITHRLKEHYKKTGNVPKMRTVKNDIGFSVNYIKNRFGSYNNALKASGLTPNRPSHFELKKK